MPAPEGGGLAGLLTAAAAVGAALVGLAQALFNRGSKAVEAEAKFRADLMQDAEQARNFTVEAKRELDAAYRTADTWRTRFEAEYLAHRKCVEDWHREREQWQARERYLLGQMEEAARSLEAARAQLEAERTMSRSARLENLE